MSNKENDNAPYLTNYLPIKNPLKFKPEDEKFFYNNIARYLIEDIVKITINGIPIDLNKVKDLEIELDNTINEADKLINDNIIIKKFLNSKNKAMRELKLKEFDSKYKIEEFDNNKKSHINYLIDSITEEILNEDYKRLPNTNWTIKKIKDIQLKTNNFLLQLILEKKYNSSALNEYKTKAMTRLYEDKFKEKRELIKNKVYFETFNVHSNEQIRELLNVLGFTSDVKTTNGQDSFNRETLIDLYESLGG